MSRITLTLTLHGVATTPDGGHVAQHHTAEMRSARTAADRRIASQRPAPSLRTDSATQRPTQKPATQPVARQRKRK